MFPDSILKQGLDDRVVPPSMTEYIGRVLPEAVIHKLPNEGHFSYFFFCDECHRQIFSTLFGTPQGPFERQEETAFEENNTEDVLQVSVSNMEWGETADIHELGLDVNNTGGSYARQSFKGREIS